MNRRGWNLRDRPTRTAVCHPNRKHCAFGLCRPCYLARPDRRRASCHPDRPEIARGKCHSCLDSGYRLKRQFGLTTDQLQAIFDAQLGACEICGGSTRRGLGLVPDHDHRTGRLRGLLCDRCNTGLGQFRDDPVLLDSAIAYLDRHRHQEAVNG